MTENRPRALMILGPTASGKTSAALALAARFPVEVISVDSALVYRGMDIGTAKPTLEERSVCPHHLIDIRSIAQSYSAAEFCDDASRLIGEIHLRGRLPVLVGGTMLYANSLRGGLDEMPPTDPAVREEVLAEGAELGWPFMHGKLMAVDPKTAERLAPGDSQRISRALEVYRMTGKPISMFHSGRRRPDVGITTIGLIPADRAILHRRIGDRFERMLRDGFEEEVRDIMARPDFDPALPSMRAVGYRQALRYLCGRCSRKEFIESGKAATRQLAKRQITWLRSMELTWRLDPFAHGESALVDGVSRLAETAVP